jgi:hypothetical protein
MIMAGMLLISDLDYQILLRYLPVSAEERPIVDDAIRRWSKKTGGNEQDLRGRIPIVIHLPQQRCVELRLLVPAVGGSPVYCYELKSDRLTVAADNVE